MFITSRGQGHFTFADIHATVILDKIVSAGNILGASHHLCKSDVIGGVTHIDQGGNVVVTSGDSYGKYIAIRQRLGHTRGDNLRCTASYGQSISIRGDSNAVIQFIHIEGSDVVFGFIIGHCHILKHSASVSVAYHNVVCTVIQTGHAVSTGQCLGSGACRRCCPLDVVRFHTAGDVKAQLAVIVIVAVAVRCDI